MSEYIAKRIRELREQRGYTQDELASRLGYTSRTSIAKVEAGKVDLPQSKIKAFADALGTTPSYLMGPVEDDHVDDIAQALHQNPKLRILFDKSRKMSDADMDAVLSIVNAITKERDG